MIQMTEYFNEYEKEYTRIMLNYSSDRLIFDEVPPRFPLAYSPRPAFAQSLHLDFYTSQLSPDCG